ncbi:MAG: RNA pseudouridine synthase [Flavobacteriaceae bacterium]|nr:RNA pseudouridine synthase [Flavobacteriaceae bacterium]|tara:strand:+ start:13623 stop:14657 length:1035 start_codon:yes stop_codon:yes gene_type:complete
MENFNNKIDPLIDESLHEHHSFVADKGQEPLRVDKFLMNRIENSTRNKIQQAAKSGNIYVNGNVVKSNYKIKGNDNIQILFNYPPYENLLLPENINIDIEYEDDSFLIVNKPPNMVVHPGHGNYSGTLINGLIYKFNKLPIDQNHRPGLVHRIDKDTSGLLVVAKSEKSMTFLTKQFYKKSIQREYHALVWGNVEKDKGRIDINIGRNPKNRLQMTTFIKNDQGKSAITHYKVIKRYGYVTHIKCILETGRTHQIRVHMKHIGHTIFNDERYGGSKILKGTHFTKYKQFVENCFKIIPRQVLHAKTIGFIHPKSKEFFSFDSDLPEDFKNVLSKWERYSKSTNL